MACLNALIYALIDELWLDVGYHIVQDQEVRLRQVLRLHDEYLER